MKLNHNHIVLKAPSVEAAKKWIEENDPYYFKNYEGDCYLICDSTYKWSAILANPRNVESTLLNADILSFHILAEVGNGEIYNWDSLHEWFNRTLAKIQMEVKKDILNEMYDKLVNKWGMMYDEGGVFKITRLGRVSAKLYFMPKDVFHWAVHFNAINKGNLWDSDLALSYALGTTPSLDLSYVPKADVDRVSEYTSAVAGIWPGSAYEIKPSVIACNVYDLLSQGANSPTIRNLQNDGERIVQALSWIDGIKSWNQTAYWKALPIRLRYGIGKELVDLCTLPGVGAVRAKKLYAAGVKNIKDVVKLSSVVKKIMGDKTSDKTILAARNMLKMEKEVA
jgi:helicase